MELNYGLDLALSHAIKGDHEKSEEILRQLDNQNHPSVRFNLGWHDMRKGFLKKGYEGLNFGRWIECYGLPPLVNKKIWHGEELTDKTLLFRCEGGFGDQIMNIRFIHDFYKKGAKIIVACAPELFCLFERITQISALVDNSYCNGMHCDYWVPAMSAPYILDYEYPDLKGAPYYFSEKYDSIHIKSLNNKHNTNYKNVGIRWAGNPKCTANIYRAFDSSLLIDIIQGNGNFYSFQRDNDLIDLPANIFDLQNHLTSWYETSRWLLSMDLLITSCTSVAHLAGALGVPTWIIVPKMPYYSWALPGNKTPWYDSVTIYRQKQETKQIFEEISQDLESFLV